MNIISAATIEAFIKFLNITEDDTEYDVNLKLNGSMKLQESQSLKKQATKKYASQPTNKKGRETSPIKEEDDEDLGRQ